MLPTKCKTDINMYQILFLLFILFFTSCGRQNPEMPLVETSTLQHKIDSVGNKFIEQGKVVGMSIAIMKANDTLYNNSFGFVDSLRSTPAQNDDIFLMASISKLVGATIIMKLVEEDVLDLEDKLIDLLPDFPVKDQAKQIELRHLISMTSGLKEYSKEIDSVYLSTGINPKKADYYNFFHKHELEFSPGSYYKYVNSGFLLLPMIIEEATNSTFEDQLDRIINQPTGFDIKLISDRLKNAEMTDYFELTDSAIINRPHWPWIKGDGGMTISAIQLAQFPIKWMDGTILSKQSFQQMIAPTKLGAGFDSEYGLGVKNGNFEGEKIYGHSGGDQSTYSMMFHFPNLNTTIVVMVNTNNTPASARNIFSEIARITLGKDKPNFKSKEKESSSLSLFTGIYLSPGDKPSQGAHIIFNPTDQHLYYSFSNEINSGEKMYYLGNNEFWIERWPYDRVKFVKNSVEEVVGLKEFYGGYMSQLRIKIK